MKSAVKLGKVQHRIMQVLWDRGPIAARDITDTLNTESPIAHSTVQTLLRKMEEKGAVTHEQRERTFLFAAKVPENEVVVSATRDLLDRLFSGSVSSLVSHLLEHEEVSEDEMKRLRTLVESVEEEKP